MNKTERLRAALPTITSTTTITLEDANLAPEQHCLIYTMVAGMAVCHFFGREVPFMQAGNREIVIGDVDNPDGALVLDYGEDERISLDTGWFHTWIVLNPCDELKTYWTLDLAAVHVPRLCVLNKMVCEFTGEPYFASTEDMGIRKPYQLGQVQYTAVEKHCQEAFDRVNDGRYDLPGYYARIVWDRIRDSFYGDGR